MRVIEFFGNLKISISGLYLIIEMTQDEKWNTRYNEVRDYIESNHRNPSKHYVENRNLLSWVKQQRKLMNAGALKPNRVEAFKKLMEIWEENKHINQYQ